MSARTAAGGGAPARHALHGLAALGQSPWLDFTTRDLIRTRELARLIREDGVRGLTTNPTIFERAIAGSAAYDADIRALAEAGHPPAQILRRLMVGEVQEACDAFGDLYHESQGRDGFVSLEVSPHLAHDADGTVAEARELVGLVARRNLMVKIPGTRAGVAAAGTCLRAGINVNVTLLFSVERYRQVHDAYLAALGARRAAGLPLDRIASVASFFVSRVDSAVDRALSGLDTPAAAPLRSTAAIANAALAYDAFTRTTGGAEWRTLSGDGARVQRPLWASTSVKDPALPTLLYCEALIAPATVNTLPPETLVAYRTGGAPAVRLDEAAVARAHGTLRALEALGISLETVAAELERDGLEKFAASWDSLLSAVERKAAALATRA